LKAEIVNGKGRATVRWGTSPEAIAKRKEVAEVILQNISVGYQINETEYTEDDQVLASRTAPTPSMPCSSQKTYKYWQSQGL
tara:strand:- start:1565 stop:1810 length:246 start_codon:yes stop_codon:yes gene_type:complete